MKSKKSIEVSDWKVKCCYDTDVDQQCLLVETKDKSQHKHKLTKSKKKRMTKFKLTKQNKRNKMEENWMELINTF